MRVDEQLAVLIAGCAPRSSFAAVADAAASCARTKPTRRGAAAQGPTAALTAGTPAVSSGLNDASRTGEAGEVAQLDAVFLLWSMARGEVGCGSHGGWTLLLHEEEESAWRGCHRPQPCAYAPTPSRMPARSHAPSLSRDARDACVAGVQP